jgi:hypothetical protein
MAERAAVAGATVGDTDLLTVTDVRRLAADTSGPRVSIYLPTHRRGAEVRQNPLQLRNLLDRAAEQLAAQDVDAGTIDKLLTPARDLLDDGDFWQHQADGLALFASPEVQMHFRTSRSFIESATVAATYHVAPLTPLLSGDGMFHILALSQNSVRLFEASRFTVTELDTGPIPASIAEALAHEDPERQLQVRAVGGGDAAFHGHGAGEEYDKGEVERYLRAVEHGLYERLGVTGVPLVLACVAYYVPIFRAVSHRFDIAESAVEGNPEHVHATDLHAAAWECVAQRFAAGAARSWERYLSSAGTGNAVDALDAIADRSVEGRIDTLFVNGDLLDSELARGPGGSYHDVELLDRAILGTVAGSGDVVCCTAGELPNDTVAAALLRY